MKNMKCLIVILAITCSLGCDPPSQSEPVIEVYIAESKNGENISINYLNHNHPGTRTRWNGSIVLFQDEEIEDYRKQLLMVVKKIEEVQDIKKIKKDNIQKEKIEIPQSLNNE